MPEEEILANLAPPPPPPPAPPPAAAAAAAACSRPAPHAAVEAPRYAPARANAPYAVAMQQTWSRAADQRLDAALDGAWSKAGEDVDAMFRDVERDVQRTLGGRPF